MSEEPSPFNEGASDLRNSRRRTAATAGVPKMDRPPPNSIEAEQGVLGCILLSPKDCIVDCIKALRPGPLVFYDLRHQLLYETMIEMWDDIEPIDVITLHQTLKDKGQMDAVGGLAYLSTLPDQVPSAANLSYYLDIVLEKYVLRKTFQTCTGVVAKIYDYGGDVEELLDSVEKDILAIRLGNKTSEMLPAKELVQSAISIIEECHANQGTLAGLSTGFYAFDRMTTGLHEGEMIVIAARPSIGKTSLAMNVAEHVVLESKLPVGVFSLEMTARQLMLRMICSHARVNSRNVRDGLLAERDFPKLTGAAGKLGAAPIHIDDSSGLSILQLRAKARRMHQQHGVKLFIIDYLQLLHSTSRRADNRQQEISDISGGIKDLAKELKVPVLVLSQLNRELEKRGKGERPRLSDIRESGSVEQDADLVGLLFQESKKDEEDDYDQESIPITLFIAKQRNGPIGDVDLTFLKSFTRFESVAKVSEEDMPGYKAPHNDP